MRIKFLKDTEDIRENRSKVIKKDTTIICTKELGNKYVKMKVASEVATKPSDVIRTAKEVKDFQNKQEE